LNWLGLIVAILQAVAGFSKYLGDRQLIEAAKAAILVEGLERTLDYVQKSNVAAAAVADPDSSYAKAVRDRYERKGDQQ
jgi:hypothetical protein